MADPVSFVVELVDAPCHSSVQIHCSFAHYSLNSQIRLHRREFIMSTPTPTKTGKKTASIGSDDEDPITPMREKFAKELRPKGRLPHLSNVTAAIQKELDMIRTLMKHCKQAIEHGGQKLLPNTLITRRDFDVVEAYYLHSKSDKGFVMFKSIPLCEEKEFNITPLIKLPSELDIFRIETLKSGLIKFDVLFEMSSVLHDSILTSFLTNLKNHLVKVNFCLTGIHEWLNKTATNKPFLERAFGRGTIATAVRRAKVDPACAKCGHWFKSHKSFGSLKNVCPGSSGFPVMQFKRSSTLYLSWFQTDSKINESFTLSDENQRARLLKLIEFVSHK